MISDDTEHACMVAQALIVSGGDEGKFVNSLAWRFRFWLLGAPAGIGLATLKAILKLWVGFSPERSGVHSAGNGPAMRSAILGVVFGEDRVCLRRMVKLSTRITHTDFKAEAAALTVALAAHFARTRDFTEGWQKRFCETLRLELGAEGGELLTLVENAALSVLQGQRVQDFADRMGLSRGISGYSYHTIPMVMRVWFEFPMDIHAALLTIVRCGGDTDTTAAILGGIIGASVGQAGIPRVWLDAMMERPRSVTWIKELARVLNEVVESKRPGNAVKLSIPMLLLRNLVFAVVVLGHGFRRLLPPY